MNWHSDWDYDGNPDGWNDGRAHGIFGTSAAIVPRTLAKRLWRVIVAVIIVAGLAGGAFQAYQASRIVARVVSSPHDHTKYHSHRKD